MRKQEAGRGVLIETWCSYSTVQRILHNSPLLKTSVDHLWNIFWVAPYSIKCKLHSPLSQIGHSGVRGEETDLPLRYPEPGKLCHSVPLIDKYEVGQREWPSASTHFLKKAKESMDLYHSYS